jgi:hypothetical protein
MCSVLISEREASQIDTTTVTIVSVLVARTVRASGVPTIYMADDHGYADSVKT